VSPTRGEVWLYERPDRKPRPVLVLTRPEAIDPLSRILVVPATRSVRDIPTHVRLDENDGMREPCALALDNTFASRKALSAHQYVHASAGHAGCAPFRYRAAA